MRKALVVFIDFRFFVRRHISRWPAICLLWWIPAVMAEPVPLVVYAATDREVVAEFIQLFEGRHPDIRVDYRDLNSSRVFERVRSETAENAEVDVVWSSAMDLQMKLLNDGYAQPHRSAETMALPSWARWRDEGFGTTYEPVAIVYARKAVPESQVPRTHAELLQIVGTSAAKVATYNPRRSGLGYMLHSQDSTANPVMFWKMAHAMGAVGVLAEDTTNAMLDRIARGEARYGYNVLGSYALRRAAHDAAIGVVLPRDYTLVLSRVAFISRRAPHPEAARVFLDFMLSRDGQAALSRGGLFAVRDDVEGARSATSLRKELGKAFRPIALSTGLMAHLDDLKRGLFLTRWDGETRTK
jgi:iron(III) transport system substrate-binding protein